MESNHSRQINVVKSIIFNLKCKLSTSTSGADAVLFFLKSIAQHKTVRLILLILLPSCNKFGLNSTHIKLHIPTLNTP